MSTVQKFTFDLDFSEPEAPTEPEVVVDEEEELEPEIEIPTFSEEDIERARAEGHDAGREEGRRDAAAATEQRLVEGIDQLGVQLTEIFDAQVAANQEIAREMLAVAVGIAKKMFPDLNARNALGEIEKVVQETLNAINEEPRVQIFVHPDLRESFGDRLATISAKAAYDGKVFVNPDGALDVGDCRVEWSNGSAIRDTTKLWEMVDAIVERNLHGDPDEVVETTTDNAPVTAEPEVTEPVAAPDTSAQGGMEPSAESESTVENEGDVLATDTSQDDTTAQDIPVPTATDSSIDGQPETFMPDSTSEADTAETENINIDQDVMENPGPAPIPHEFDDVTASGTDDNGGEENQNTDTPPLGGDAMSQETTAAILDAQGSMHDATDPSPPEDTN